MLQVVMKALQMLLQKYKTKRKNNSEIQANTIQD